jgi:hypothetical protein
MPTRSAQQGVTDALPFLQKYTARYYLCRTFPKKHTAKFSVKYLLMDYRKEICRIKCQLYGCRLSMVMAGEETVGGTEFSTKNQPLGQYVSAGRQKESIINEIKGDHFM